MCDLKPARAVTLKSGKRVLEVAMALQFPAVSVLMLQLSSKKVVVIAREGGIAVDVYSDSERKN